MLPAQAVACPLCGAAHAVCGQATSSTPLDIPTGKEPSVGPVRKYKVTTNGHATVLKLNDEDVKAYPDAELVDEPADDAATTAADSGSTDDAAGKTRTAANKARRATGDKASG